MDSAAIFGAVMDNMEKVIVGKRKPMELILIALACEGHVLIEDVPGVGKTSIVSSLAKSLDLSFNRIQFTPDILPSDITGFSIYNQKSGEFEYRQGAVMSNIILADEINRTSPKTQSSLLEVMEERQVTVDGITCKLPRPFMIMATQNPIDYIGTYPLPEAQMDRFFIKISIGYPTIMEESDILLRFQYENPIDHLKPVAGREDIIQWQEKVRTVHVDRSLCNYISTLIDGMRRHRDVVLGPSPRGSLALFRACQAFALFQGRDYAIPDDIQKMAIPVLEHRIILKQEAKLKKINPSDIIEEVLRNTRVPVVDDNERK